MAKAASMVREWLDGYGNGAQTLILRFLGTSAQSSNISQLLNSLCHQIAYACGHKRLEKLWFSKFKVPKKTGRLADWQLLRLIQ